MHAEFRPRRFVRLLLIALATGYLGACVLLTSCQSKLIWFPGKPGGVTPRDEGLEFEDLTLKTLDGERLHAWFLPAKGEPRGALLLSHGNAGTIEDRLDVARFFVEARVSVLLYDYRGYGSSTGSPSEEGTSAPPPAAWKGPVHPHGPPPPRNLTYRQSPARRRATE